MVKNTGYTIPENTQCPALEFTTVVPHRGNGGRESGSAAVPYVAFPAERLDFARTYR